MPQPNVNLGPVSALHAQGSAQGAPEWVHLVPAGSTLETADRRGPFRLDDPAKVIAASMELGRGKLAIDENHATDLAAPQGGPSPARGWIVELQQRADGIWGRVEWTPAGEALLAEGAYRGLSPVLLHRKDGTVIAVLRAALTNTPNLRGLTALHSQTTETHVEELLKKLRAALGLKDTDDQAVVLNAIGALKGEAGDLLPKLREALGLAETADAITAVNAAKQLRGWNGMRTALMSIAKHAGLREDADATSIVVAVESLVASAKSGTVSAETVASLQAEIGELTTKLNAMTSNTAKDKATAFIDGEIAKGRVGVKPLRDHYIAQHAIDPARVEKEISAMPILNSGTRIEPPAKNRDGKIVLNAEQQNAAKLLGIKPDDYAKTLAAEAANEEAA